MLDDRVSTLIRHIYEAAHDFAAWDKVLDQILRLTGSRVMMVSAVDLRAGEFTRSNFYGADDGRFLDGVRDYTEHLYQTDPTLAFGRKNPEAGFVSLRMALAGIDVEFEKHPYVRWVGEELGVANSVVCYSSGQNELTLGVSLHPSCSRGEHDEQDVRLFRMLFSHMEQSMRLVARPPDLTGDAEAIVVLDQHARVLALSQPAERLLACNDGLSISRRSLRAANAADEARLLRSMSCVLASFVDGKAGEALPISRRSGRRPYVVTVGPFLSKEALFSAFQPAILVRIVDPAEGPPANAIAVWRSIYGLTMAEGRLAEALVRGDGNMRQIADKLGIAYATARVQLASLFEKTSSNSQSQLVSLLSKFGG